MRKFHWLLALPLVLAASIGSACASSIRDNAGLFDPDAVRQAEAKLNRIERDSKVTTTIETIDSLRGESIEDATLRHAKASGTQGLYILIAKRETKIEVEASRVFANALTRPRRVAIRNAFVDGFKRQDFDSGLKWGVEAIESEIAQAKAENGGVLRQTVPAPGVPVRGRPAHRGSFGLGWLLTIGLLILAVLFGIRLLGRLFGGGYRAGYPGPRPMGGPGYGGPGYGGGGGFWSSMFGGIGGALAGNWLYDQFSGRHHGGYVDNTTSGPSDEGGQIAESGGNDWVGTGGAGWGGGDSGGGADWGGGGDGGGDWGGGGDGGAGGDW